MISLGLDIGATGCKCVAFHDAGTQLALAYREYPTKLGAVNLDPVLLSDSVFSVIRGCVDQLENPGEVAAITVSSFGESFVPVSASGAPLTDIVLYFANAESRDFEDLVNSIGRERFMEIACIPPDASYSLAKMLQAKKIVAEPVWKFLFVASYVCFCLSGGAVTDYSLASRSLLFDVRRLDWSRELLDATGIRREELPDVGPTGVSAGHLLPDVASKLGLSQSVQVIVGGHDQILNALGAGVSACGEAVDITGTVECIEPLFSAIPEGHAFQEDNYACEPFLQGRGYVTHAYNISGGATVKWYRDALALHLRQEAARRGCSIYDLLNETCPAEPTDLMVLPHLQGMGGTPDVLTGARGVFYGLSMHTSLPDIYRAILEGLTFEMAYNQEKLRAYGIVPSRLYACGGGARSRMWLQIKADILGCELHPSQVEETGAMGNAILGFAAVTGAKDVFALAKPFLRHGDVVSPIPAHTDYYRERFALYKKIRAFSVEDARKS